MGRPRVLRPQLRRDSLGGTLEDVMTIELHVLQSLAVGWLLAFGAACSESTPRTDRAARVPDSAHQATPPFGDVPWLGDRTGDQAPAGIVNDTCLAANELALDGISLHMSATAARRRLGSPQRIVNDSGVDDGGTYVVERWHYHLLMVEVVRGRVDRVVTTSSQVRTPAGLRVGVTIAEVRSVLQARGFEIGAVADSLEVPDCGAPSGYVILHFSSEDWVDRIELQAARP